MGDPPRHRDRRRPLRLPAHEPLVRRQGRQAALPGGTFTASPVGIEAGGATIARDALHRLIVRNGVPNVGDTVVVADNGSVYGGMQAGAARDRAANRAKAAEVSYMLCTEAGGRSTTLAGGMTEVTAHGLMTDTSRVTRPRVMSG